LVSYGPARHLVDPCGPFTETAATAAATSIAVLGDDTAAGRMVFVCLLLELLLHHKNLLHQQVADILLVFYLMRLSEFRYAFF